jgi:hypothetical protein
MSEHLANLLLSIENGRGMYRQEECSPMLAMLSSFI